MLLVLQGGAPVRQSNSSVTIRFSLKPIRRSNLRAGKNPDMTKQSPEFFEVFNAWQTQRTRRRCFDANPNIKLYK
jgi:hypothetical protein